MFLGGAREKQGAGRLGPDRVGAVVWEGEGEVGCADHWPCPCCRRQVVSTAAEHARELGTGLRGCFGFDSWQLG